MTSSFLEIESLINHGSVKDLAPFRIFYMCLCTVVIAASRFVEEKGNL